MKRPGEQHLGKGNSRPKGPRVQPEAWEGGVSCGEGAGVPEAVLGAGGALEIRPWAVSSECSGKLLVGLKQESDIT